MMNQIKKLWQKANFGVETTQLLRRAKNSAELLKGLDQLITQNELAIGDTHQEIESLERVELREMARIREGQLPARTKNDTLRKIKRLRCQMDHLEEKQKVYNRNISLQVYLIGKIQVLEAMNLRGLDDSTIDRIVSNYEHELLQYQAALDTEAALAEESDMVLDDTAELGEIEREVLGRELPETISQVADEKAIQPREPTPSSLAARASVPLSRSEAVQERGVPDAPVQK